MTEKHYINASNICLGTAGAIVAEILDRAYNTAYPDRETAYDDLSKHFNLPRNLVKALLIEAEIRG